MSEDDKIQEAIKEGLSAASMVAGAVGLGTNYAMQVVPVVDATGAAVSGGEAANLVVTGGEIAGGAAAGGVVIAAASVVGAAALGYRIGTEINERTGLSKNYADAVNDADPALIVSAGQHWEDAKEEMMRDDPLGAFGDTVASAGQLAVAGNEVMVKAEEVIDKVEDLGADIVTDFL